MNSLSIINQHSLLLVRGADARKFLQGQVTCDIETLFKTDSAIQTSILGAHCTHKGRIVFTFRAIAWDNDTVALSIPSDNMKSATASLAKYIVFSKAELIDITQQYHMVGIQGKAVIATAKTYFEHWPTESGTVVNSEQGTVICLENDTCELWLSKEMSESLQQKLSTYPVYSDNYWDYVLIRLGIGEVRQASSELWTPHAINLQEIGDGVSFNKGCYTGQEVVARMEYLGTLKRKMYIFTTPATIRDLPAIATPLYTTGKIQSIGHIVTAAKNPHQPDKPAILAASVAVKQVEENEVYMDSECQHKLTLFKQG